ncbi:T9SS type A sorting domain-containing protein [Flavobacterium sp.]|uniref:T9SS type A sorting domain-containing protein n=1 Tax=Flavobacterium sp. TaxID=239 RepID=UPI00286D6E35|nr:T9SS type A sorting domain-containing protein [Flavobacterium sp.]
MKKLYFLLSIIFGFSLNAQIINFSDANFKARLLAANTGNAIAKGSFGNNIVVDTNGNGEIEVSEALNVYELYFWSDFLSTTNDIVNLDGIQSFINLKKLNCRGNSIINLDLQGLNNLEYIEAGKNNISSVNFSDLSSLKEINLNDNQLTSINIDNLISLTKLLIFSNQLQSLTFNNNSALETVWCSKNLITSLDFSTTPNLKVIMCNDNLLTSINLGVINSIIELNCYKNKLSNLNISNLLNLTYFDFSSNQISTITFPIINNLFSLNISDNPIPTINLNSLSKLNRFYASNTLITDLDCSQTAVTQLFCSNNPNIQTINTKNNVFTTSDPDLLNYGFVIENNPQLLSICVDEGEQNNLSFYKYNTSGNVIVYTGTTCSKIIVPSSMGNLNFESKNNSIVFPNPTNTILNISTNDKIIVQKAIIYNTLGQLLKIINTSSTIDVSELKAGTYFISIESENGKSTQKFIKF